MDFTNKLQNVVISLTHHQNGGFTELKAVGVYLSPAAGGGKITSTQYFLVIKVFFGGVLKG